MAGTPITNNGVHSASTMNKIVNKGALRISGRVRLINKNCERSRDPSVIACSKIGPFFPSYLESDFISLRKSLKLSLMA